MQKIKSFSVYGLFWTKDVHIIFEDSVKILVGENGIGKTQLLSIFYYTLTKNFIQLSGFSFDKIEIEFLDDRISISKEELMKAIFNYNNHSDVNNVIDAIGAFEFEKIKEDIEQVGPIILNDEELNELLRTTPVYNKIHNIAPIDHVFELLYASIQQGNQLKNRQLRTDNLRKCFSVIDANVINNSILYFPTFRRVEEDLHNLGYNEGAAIKENGGNLIHFGMDDVQARFDAIEQKIDAMLKEGFTKISGEILSRLVKGFGNTSTDVLNRIDENDIEIILARIGTQIVESDKLAIRKMVSDKTVTDKDSSQLYFLQILIEIYEKQKESEHSIKQFRDICNKYLVDKKIFYDESKIKIYVKPNDSDDALPLRKLSSGEKQIISIFSKIYLSDENQKYIVLFDEPELSLSINWQRMLLPDMVNSGKCEFLLAVTHSPFIFENELDSAAIGLREYIAVGHHKKA